MCREICKQYFGDQLLLLPDNEVALRLLPSFPLFPPPYLSPFFPLSLPHFLPPSFTHSTPHSIPLLLSPLQFENACIELNLLSSLPGTLPGTALDVLFDALKVDMEALDVIIDVGMDALDVDVDVGLEC